MRLVSWTARAGFTARSLGHSVRARRAQEYSNSVSSNKESDLLKAKLAWGNLQAGIQLRRIEA